MACQDARYILVCTEGFASIGGNWKDRTSAKVVWHCFSRTSRRVIGHYREYPQFVTRRLDPVVSTIIAKQPTIERRHFKDEFADRGRFADGLTNSTKMAANPNDINDYFESRLDQPPPQPIPGAVTTPAFEPATYSRTLHLGSNLEAELLPAYQFFRLVEESAQPPDVGNVRVDEDSLKRVAEWLSEHDPVRTQTIMLRLRDDKLVESYISRHRIAALRPGNRSKS